MYCQVFLQPGTDRGYTATILGLLGCVGYGTTKEEALANLQAIVSEQLTKGEIITLKLDIPKMTKTGNPWVDHAGIFKDDPTWDEFQDAITQYRREVDESGRLDE